MKTAKRLACVGLFGLAFLNVYAAFGATPPDSPRNPFVRPDPDQREVAPADQATDSSGAVLPALTMIYLDDDKRIAEFGDLTVEIGDDIEGWRVVAIEADSVVVRSGDVTRKVLIASS